MRPQHEKSAPRPIVHTVGHSTHPIESFLALLAQHQISLLADVRSFPSSRRWPQFNQAELQQSVERAGLRYRWLKALGGRRNLKRPDSPHTAWEHPAFRSYADYTETPEFAAGVEVLIELARGARIAIMCSEGLWWRCHRRIISDHLTVRGWDVRHIMPDGKIAMHALTDFASVRDGRIIYDGGQQALKLK
ncbi:MAG TPA: DUF488 domain-containing protein [Candidatus Binataceae bacterium]|nr:DUF488 domain-containing protein [Candidatus Binataceae bacterium]